MIYIDTGPFLGRYLQKDQYHEKAAKAWKRLEKENQSCLTSNFVLDEVLTFLARQAGYSFSAEKGKIIYDSQALEILRPSEEDERKALGLFEKFADQKVSYTDCVSFALMQKKKIKLVFSFDSHFQQAGFQRWPSY